MWLCLLRTALLATQLVVEEEERDSGVVRWPTPLAGTPATIPTRLEEAELPGEDITRGEGHMIVT